MPRYFGVGKLRPEVSSVDPARSCNWWKALSNPLVLSRGNSLRFRETNRKHRLARLCHTESRLYRKELFTAKPLTTVVTRPPSHSSATNLAITVTRTRVGLCVASCRAQLMLISYLHKPLIMCAFKLRHFRIERIAVIVRVKIIGKLFVNLRHR